MNIEIVIDERALNASGVRSLHGPLHGQKPSKRTGDRVWYVVTVARAEQVAAALERCGAFDKPDALYGRDPDLETDKYAVRIAAAMIRRALLNPRPA